MKHKLTNTKTYLILDSKEHRSEYKLVQTFIDKDTTSYELITCGGQWTENNKTILSIIDDGNGMNMKITETDEVSVNLPGKNRNVDYIHLSLNYNLADRISLLLRCIKLLNSNTFPDYNIVLTDNLTAV